MSTVTHQAIRLEDYKPSAFLISTVELDVALFAGHTRVGSRLAMRRNPADCRAHA